MCGSLSAVERFCEDGDGNKNKGISCVNDDEDVYFSSGIELEGSKMEESMACEAEVAIEFTRMVIGSLCIERT